MKLITVVMLSMLSQMSFANNIEQKKIKILGSHISYLEGGSGKTVLFIHGVPTSSYLWRNILPEVSENNHVIALDLIGHGKSGKPFIEYNIEDHLNYLEAFIEKLNLKDITFVLHDWGSAIGFIYASQHQDNIKGLAFMEAMFGPVPDPSMMPEIAIQMRGSNGWEMIVENNFFLEKMLPMMSMVPLSKKTIKEYKKPFRKKKHRWALRMWPLEVPIAGLPKNNHKLFDEYAGYLMTSDTPKLLPYSTPGILTREAEVRFVEQNFKNLKSVGVGEGLHFIQEEHPIKVTNELKIWLKTL